MKLIYFIITLLSLNAFSQEYEIDKNDPQLQYSLPSRPDRASINRTTPESVMYYIRTGYSVGNVGDLSSDFFPSAIGSRRYADEFYYGGEFSSHYGANGMQTFMTSFVMGHHFLTWRHRIKPYVGLNFGYVNISDTSEQKRPGGNGVHVGADLGFRLMKIGPFITGTGFKFDHVISSEKSTTGTNFFDLYFSFGVEF